MAGGPARRTERLMCLVFVLKAHGRRGITKAQLRTAIDDYASCTSNEAFERMLERDKRDLRDAGVVVDVVQRDAWHEDEHAYVLRAESMLTLPPLDAEELHVLALAAEAWQRGTWEALAHGALRKVEVFGSDYDDAASPRIVVTTDRHLATLRHSVRAARAVSFRYRRPGDAASTERHVEPWGLLARGGAWYCIGHDIDRDAARVFRLSRIEGEVTIDGAASHPVAEDWTRVPEANPGAFARTSATLLVRPGHGWAWRNGLEPAERRDVDGQAYDVLSVAVADDHRTIGALAAAAPHVLVAAPDDLRARVLTHLAEVGRD